MLNSTAQALTVMAVFLHLFPQGLRPNLMGMLQYCLRIHLKPCKRLVQIISYTPLQLLSNLRWL